MRAECVRIVQIHLWGERTRWKVFVFMGVSATLLGLCWNLLSFSVKRVFLEVEKGESVIVWVHEAIRT